MSGQGRYRESWSFFYTDVDGIFFVVDTADRDRLSIVQELLMEMAKHPNLRDRQIPFVILANKQDLHGHVDEEDLKVIVQINMLKTVSKMQFFIKNTIGMHGDGITECFQLFYG